MRGITFFRFSLVLPLVIPALALLLQLDMAGFLGMATFIVAAPYAIFSVWVWRHLERLCSFKEAYVFLAKAPWFFALPIAILWFVGAALFNAHLKAALTSSSQILMLLLAIAYAYSFLAAMLTAIAQISGFLRHYK